MDRDTDCTLEDAVDYLDAIALLQGDDDGRSQEEG